MKLFNHKTIHYSLLGCIAAAGMSHAATQISIEPEITLSEGISGFKPKIQRMGNNRLVVVYGDNTAGAGDVYDVKGDKERQARDIYTRTCMPSSTVSCNNPTDWTAPVNLTNSALQSSIQTAWKADDTTLYDYPGDAAKPNIKTSGPVVTLTWTSKYCPDGDMSTLGIVDGAVEQRAIQYLERENRVIPFSCTWAAWSTNFGANWSSPVQLSSGIRDAIQDSSRGAYNSTAKTGQVAITWQEDPQGLKIGEADGPGDGASGANVHGGTDVWYTYATVDLSVAATPADDYVLQQPVRLTDNFTGQYGVEGNLVLIYDDTGSTVNENTVEKGQAGAARPNVGMVGSTTIVAYEETKGSEGLDEGKFIRYHTFPYNTPPAADPGCVISNPHKNARRVRFLTQSPADAGAGGTQIAVFWKEGAYDKGGPSDIVVRRGIDGLTPADMTPSVDSANCETSVYEDVIALSNTPGDNISSNTPAATTANLSDDTEEIYTENSLAHRGVLRGSDLWIGYNYTADLINLWAGLDNYNFWVRYMDTGTGVWENPMNLSNITDTGINVREPRFVGTPKSSSSACPSGDPEDVTTTDPTLCQDADVIWVAWGTQTNVSPYDPEGPQDLGEYITASTNKGESFQAPVKLSDARGIIEQDDDSAFEAQIVLRPDGREFYGVWNQQNLINGNSQAQYTSGGLDGESEPAPTLHGSLKSHSTDKAGAFTPLMLAALGILLAIRRRLAMC